MNRQIWCNIATQISASIQNPTHCVIFSEKLLTYHAMRDII